MKKSTEEMLFWGAAAVGLVLVLKSKSSAAANPATVPATKPTTTIADPGAGFAAGGGVAPNWGLGPMPDPNDPAWGSPTQIDAGTLTIGGQSSMSGYFYDQRRRRR